MYQLALRLLITAVTVVLLLSVLLPSGSLFAQTLGLPDCGSIQGTKAETLCGDESLVRLLSALREMKLVVSRQVPGAANDLDALVDHTVGRLNGCIDVDSAREFICSREELRRALRKVALFSASALGRGSEVVAGEVYHGRTDLPRIEMMVDRIRHLTPDILYHLVDQTLLGYFNEVSCSFFHTDPKHAAIAFGAYWGASGDAWLPLCSQLRLSQQVPAVQELKESLIVLEGDGGANGTMSFAYRRQQSLADLLAALDPRQAEVFSITRAVERQDVLRGSLRKWSQQGAWEKRRYAELLLLLDRAAAATATYYQKEYGVPADEANTSAAAHLEDIIASHIGRTGRWSDYYYPSAYLDLEDLEHYLASSMLPPPPEEYNEDTSREATLRRLLGLAIINDYPLKVIDALLSDGALLSTHGEQGVTDTPLLMAAARTDVLKLLLAAGADPNDQNAFGKTALMYAIQEQNLEGVAALLAAGADPNLPTYPLSENEAATLAAGLRTPLMYAAWHGSLPLIEMILAAGADPGARDSQGESAIDYVLAHTGWDASVRQAALLLLGSSSEPSLRECRHLGLYSGEYGTDAAAGVRVQLYAEGTKVSGYYFRAGSEDDRRLEGWRTPSGRVLLYEPQSSAAFWRGRFGSHDAIDYAAREEVLDGTRTADGKSSSFNLHRSEPLEDFLDGAENPALPFHRERCNDSVCYRFVTLGDTEVHLPRMTRAENAVAATAVNRLLDEWHDGLRCIIDELPEPPLPTPQDFEIYAQIMHQRSFADAKFKVSAVVSYAANELFSIRTEAEYFCGGPYPGSGPAHKTFDLRSGREVSFEELFDNYEERKELILARIFSEVNADAAPIEASELHDGGEPPCQNQYRPELLRERNFTYYLTADKLVVTPDFPHVLQACARTVRIPYGSLRPFRPRGGVLDRAAAK